MLYGSLDIRVVLNRIPIRLASMASVCFLIYFLEKSRSEVGTG
jgi:hypothetical protein